MGEEKYCIFCGVKITSLGVEVCAECSGKIKTVNKLNTLEKAVKMLRGKKVFSDIRTRFSSGEYDNAICEVRKKINDGINFGSKEEIIIAIELEYEGIKYTPQYRIGSHKLDFMLDEANIILEVDGSIYHSDENAGFLRDRAIMRAVGESYEIIHLDSTIIPRYTTHCLIEALKHVVTQRDEQRRFRDSYYDSEYMIEFDDLRKSVRGRRN